MQKLNISIFFAARSLLSSHFFLPFSKQLSRWSYYRDAIGRYNFITSTSFCFFFDSVLAKARIVAEVGTRSLEKKTWRIFCMQNIKFAFRSDLIKKISRLWKHILTINWGGDGKETKSQFKKYFRTFEMNFSAKSRKLLNIFLLFFFSKKKSSTSSVYLFAAASFCGLEVFIFSLPSPSQHTCR